MKNTIKKITTIGAMFLALASVAGDLNYNASVASGVENNVLRYGVQVAGTSAFAGGNLQVGGIPYVDTFDMGATVNVATANNANNLTVITTGLKRKVYGDFAARVGVDYAAFSAGGQNFNSGIGVSYEKYSFVKPSVGYAYDYIRKMNITEALLPISNTYTKVPWVDSVTLTAFTGYNYYESGVTGNYQTVNFGVGTEIKVIGPVNLFATGTYYYALNGSTIAFSKDWVAVGGIKIKF